MAAKKERKNAAVVKQPSQFVGRGQIRFVTVSAPLKNKFRGELPFKFSFFPIKKFAIHFIICHQHCFPFMAPNQKVKFQCYSGQVVVVVGENYYDQSGSLNMYISAY